VCAAISAYRLSRRSQGAGCSLRPQRLVGLLVAVEVIADWRPFIPMVRAAGR
jgi:hypothetical protein